MDFYNTVTGNIIKHRLHEMVLELSIRRIVVERVLGLMEDHWETVDQSLNKPSLTRKRMQELENALESLNNAIDSIGEALK